jgi:2-polyprenyl-6-methoxyphenol hydroxylase-like FAD-dependent oxidoreductase
MKIAVIGGGPSGLYFAILMRRLGHEVEVFERNARDATFGWGVVFSDRTMRYLAEPDPETHRLLLEHLRTWENVDIVHRGELISVAGNRFSGIARIALLEVLQKRASELGVALHFEREVSDPLELSADLIVGADGVNSLVRARLAEHFEPSLELGNNRYIWYGTVQPFGGLTLTFRPGPLENLFMAHSYKYSGELSTFIVEVDEPTWRNIEHLDEPDSRDLLERVFAADLGGHPLLSNFSRWIRFTVVKNRHWFHRNVVLLGDALHTAHFSIGSGTKLALEDSIALWEAFRAHPRVQDALPAFEAARRPQVEEYQAVSELSRHWFENARQLMHLEPLPFAYEAMTRSSRVDDNSLARRDPAFVAAYREYLARGA